MREHSVQCLKRSDGQVGIVLRKQVQQINQGELKKPKRGIKRQEWDVRQDSTSNEAILGKMCV